MLWLNHQTCEPLKELTTYYGESNAEVIRQLITQARPEDFPQSWQVAEAYRNRTHPPGA